MNLSLLNTAKKGYFGQFGGQFVPETLMPALSELEIVFENMLKDQDFQLEFCYESLVDKLALILVHQSPNELAYPLLLKQ